MSMTTIDHVNAWESGSSHHQHALLPMETTRRPNCSANDVGASPRYLVLLACWLTVGVPPSTAQDPAVASPSSERVRYYQDSQGTTWREERSVVRQPVRAVQLEPQEQRVYREQYRTQMEQYQYLSYSPVVQYEWVPRLHDWWRVFQQPYVAYHLEPQVQWQARSYAVQVPVTQRELVAETRTAHVPVARLKFEDREQVTRTAVTPDGPSLAQQLPGTTLDPHERGGWVAAPRWPASSSPVDVPPGEPRSAYGGIARMDDGLPRVGTAPTRSPVR